MKLGNMAGDQGVKCVSEALTSSAQSVMLMVQAAMPSPAGTWTSDVESFLSTPESGELRPSSGRQPQARSRLAPDYPATEEAKQAAGKDIFGQWDDDDEVVI